MLSLPSNKSNKKGIKRLTCCCCGQFCRGRQWYNRDTGYGLCPNCAKWLREVRHETEEDMKHCYGIEGIHYNVVEFSPAGTEHGN